MPTVWSRNLCQLLRRSRLAAQWRFNIFHKSIIFRNAPSCPPSLFASNKSNLAGELARDKGSWNEAPPTGLPAVTWKVMSKALLLQSLKANKSWKRNKRSHRVLFASWEETHKHTHSCSTATVYLHKHYSFWIRLKNKITWTILYTLKCCSKNAAFPL